MKSSQFKIVFSLKLFHSYFEDGISDNWIYTPSEQTKSIFQRYDFKLNVQPAGFDLYANCHSSLTDYLTYINTSTGLDYFDFKISSSDEFLYMATELPINEVGYFRFDNHNEDNQVGEDKVELEGDWIKSEDSNEIAQLRIYFDEIKNRIKLNQPVDYQINISARSTQWEYYIINSSGLELENLKIEGKSKIDFEGPEKVKLQNNQPALSFVSGNDLIPLSEIPHNIFDLVAEKDNSKNKIIVKGLPNPSLSQFGTIENNGSTLVSSPMYVYV